MANIFLVSRILLLFQSAKYEKLGKYWSYSTRNCAITNAYHFPFCSVIDNIECLQVLVVQRRSCQLQINSPVMASLNIYKLKIKAKLQEKTPAKRDISIQHLPTESCVDLRSQSFVFNQFCFDQLPWSI